MTYFGGVPNFRALKKTQKPEITARTKPITVSTTWGLPTTLSQAEKTANAAIKPKNLAM